MEFDQQQIICKKGAACSNSTLFVRRKCTIACFQLVAAEPGRTSRDSFLAYLIAIWSSYMQTYVCRDVLCCQGHRKHEVQHRFTMLLSAARSLSRCTALSPLTPGHMHRTVNAVTTISSWYATMLSPPTPADMQHAYRRLKRARDQEKSRFQSHDVLHSRYLLMNLLGKGGFSEVYKVRCPD